MKQIKFCVKTTKKLLTMFLKDDIINSNDSLRRIKGVSKKMRHWLIEIRGKRSQQSVADKIGISRGAYANIELGKRNPSVQLAKKIGEALGFVWTLFFDEEVVVSKQKSNTA